MDEREILRAQVKSSIDNLNWAERSLKKLKTGSTALSEAVQSRFAILFKERRTELEKLQKRLAAGAALTGAWETFGRYQEGCDELFRECLSYLGGILLRRDKLDNSIGEIADSLLREISKKATVEWQRLTILAAEGNFFTETTEVIRLPFPDFSIWNLPIAVHELGHYVGPRIHDALGENPFKDVLNEVEAAARAAEQNARATKANLQQPAFFHEFFSDLFAIYTLGPAYACCCIITRFSPYRTSICQHGKTHPGDDHRVRLMLMALEEMDEESDPSLSGAITFLRELWEKNLKVVVKGAEPNYLPELRLKVLLKLYPILNKYVFNARYPRNGWNRALSLAEELESDVTAENLRRPKDTIVDVLNGAWAWRIQQPAEDRQKLDKVNAKAIKMCLLIARPKEAGA